MNKCKIKFVNAKFAQKISKNIMGLAAKAILFFLHNRSKSYPQILWVKLGVGWVCYIITRHIDLQTEPMIL